jgi:hypothetical protein
MSIGWKMLGRGFRSNASLSNLLEGGKGHEDRSRKGKRDFGVIAATSGHRRIHVVEVLAITKLILHHGKSGHAGYYQAE